MVAATSGILRSGGDMPVRATHSNREKRGKTGTFLPSTRSEQGRKTPQMISHTGFCTQNVTHSTLVFLIFLNLTRRTLTKAEELGEALCGREASIKRAVSAKALRLTKRGKNKRERSSASTKRSLLTCLLGCRLPLTLLRVL